MSCSKFENYFMIILIVKTFCAWVKGDRYVVHRCISVKPAMVLVPMVQISSMYQNPACYGKNVL